MEVSGSLEDLLLQFRPPYKKTLGTRYYRVFSSRDPHGTVRIRIVEDPTLISGNQIFQKLLPVRAKKEGLADGYSSVPHVICQMMETHRVRIFRYPRVLRWVTTVD
ncbi:unnamed protein product [Nippostrongylus brasiliensis]|uniref:Ras-associating domain-containing protein n=1 Tax=Nippostrongylus brasiliensis TaxID=27835 RepID=A0A0N4XWP9_NIPBR|nr:unnamed protein product [Nippostrongylus brasiliensis]